MRQAEARVEVAGTGHYLPERVLTNADLEEMVDTTDEWIRERTGIRERRLAAPDENAAEMGAEASRRAMADAGVEPGEVDLLLVSTATPDRLLPSTACDIQALLGADHAMALDISAACSGWLYALTLAEGFLTAGHGEVALVVAAEKMSAIVDWTDRSTCVLFGDGAGAAVLRPAQGSRGIVGSFHRSDGSLGDLLFRPGGGARIPMDEGVLERRDHLLKMEGREVFRNAVRSMAEAADRGLAQAGLTGDDVDIMVPHQANTRIIEATARYAGIPMEKVYVNVDRCGNMSSASIPVGLDQAVKEGRIEAGMNVLSVAFGAGFTWGSTVFRW
jgi:3-oxoacyl-[acyl-carrier-protein] synthase-3